MRPVVWFQKVFVARDLRTRVFQWWWRVSRSATLGVRGIVRREDGHVLLVRHTYTPGWHFPGGGVERGETCLSALLRELAEEAGVIPINPPELVSVHANHASFPNDHVLVYCVDAWETVKPTSRGEIAEVRFCDPRNPPDGTTPGTLRRLAELIGDVQPATDW